MAKTSEPTIAEAARAAGVKTAEAMRYARFILPPDQVPDVSDKLKAKAEAKRQRKMKKRAREVARG